MKKYRVYLASTMIPTTYRHSYEFKTKAEAVKFQKFKNQNTGYNVCYFSIEKIAEKAGV